MGERRKTAGNSRNAKAGDPVGSRRTEECGFEYRNVRREERRTKTIGFYRKSAVELVAMG